MSYRKIAKYILILQIIYTKPNVYLEHEEMVSVRFAKRKLGSEVRECEKFRHSITEPLKGDITTRPAKYNQCKHKLEVDSPQYRPPFYLHAHTHMLLANPSS
jgi:hypothetical protein